MKKFKTALMTLIVSLCLVFGLAFAVACGEKETTGGGGSTTDQTQDNDTSVAHYTVTLSFDSAKGSVTKSDAASADGYVKDETVTITVSPKEGLVVDSVKAGDATLTPDADGKYSFKIVGDVTVSVTFKDAAVAVTHYTVSLSFDSEKGTVKKSDPASADGYVKDETVTITVSPKEGFAVDFVKAGDVALEPNADGTYSFKVSGNITVSVTFQSVEVTPSGTALVLDAKYQGTYHEIDGSASVADLVVSATGVKWGDKDVLLASPFEDGDLYYNVLVDGEAYELHINDADHTISLNTPNFSVEITFLKENETISFTVSVSVTNREGGTAAVTPVKPQYDQNDEVTLTVTPNEGYEIDTVTMDGGVVSLEDGVYTFNVTRNVTFVVTFKEIVVSENALILDAKYFGTYHDMNTENPSDDLVISARGVFWGDDEVLVVEENTDMGEYTVTVGDGTTEYVFKANDDGTIFLFTFDTSVDKTFLKEGVTLSFTVTVTVVSDGEWGTATLEPEQERYEQNKSVTLTVTPTQGYIVDRVSVDYEDVSLENGTTYTFLVTKNTEIYVYFKKDVSIPTEFQGVWTNILGSSDSFTLGAKEMTWGGHAVTIDSIDERITYDEVTFEPSVVGIDVSYTIDGAEGMATFLFNTSAVRIALTDPETWVEENYIFLHGDGKSTDTDITSGSFTQIGGEIKLAVGEKGHVSVGDAELPMYFLKDEMYGEVYYVLYQNAYRRLMINNDNYLTFEPADSEAADQTVLQFLRDNFTVKPYVLVAGEWNAEGGVKLNFKDDGSVELTGKEGVTIRLLASDASGTSTLVTSGNKSWEAALNPTFSESDGAYTLSFEYLLSETGATTFSRTLSKFTLDSTWQSGYVYEGIDYVPFEKFVVNETGLVPVDQFNNPIESQYAYAAATVSENEYIIVIPDPVYGSGTFYTLTLDATDHKITIKTSSGQEFVYTQGEVEPMEIFTITLSYDNTQGTVSIDGGSVDDTGMVYTFAKPDSGETVSVYISVYTKGIYETDSVKVGDRDVSYDEEMFCYVFTADGLSNVTITITFKAKTYDLLVIEDETLHNTTWSCSDPLYESTKLVIDADGHVKFGNKDVSYMDDSYNGYSVIIDGAQWTFITTDMANGTITLMDAFTEMYVFTKDGGSTTPTSFSVSVTCDVDEGTYATTMGTAEVDKETCEVGGIVTLTVTPGEGYEIATVTVDGDTVTVTEGANGVFTFTIEEVTADVVIVVTFKTATAQDAPAA